jgi:peptidoglycan/LPS O-acetylase OafA/YrhL
LLTLCGRLWAFVSVPGYVDNLLAVPSIFGAAIVFGVLSYQLVERPLLEKTRAWGKMRLPPPAARAGISE